MHRSLRRLVRPSLLFAASLLLWARQAAAAEVAVIADVGAAPALREEAGAASLLVRSMLAPAARGVAARRELQLALDAVAGPAVRDALVVDAPLAARVLDKLAADGILLGTLERKDAEARLVLRGQVVGKTGEVAADFTVEAPVGEVPALARSFARQAAARLGLRFQDAPALSPARLAPLVAADGAFTRRDPAAAARSLELAPSTTAQLPAARELALDVSREAKLAPDARAHAALTSGDAQAALTLADQALKQDARNLDARVTKARALTSLRKYSDAERVLEGTKAGPDAPQVAIARAELAWKRGDGREKRDEALAPLVGASPSVWRRVLAFVTDTQPNTFSPSLESAAVKAAEALAREEPGLASSVAVRAATGGIEVRRSLTLVRVGSHRSDELEVLRNKAAAVGASELPAAATIASTLETRGRVAKEIRLGQLGAGGDQGLRSVAEALGPLLESFERLRGGTLTRALLLGREGSGQSWLWPVSVRTGRFEAGLRAALMGPPYELTLAEKPAARAHLVSDAELSENLMAVLAAETGTDAVLLARVRPSGLSALSIELVLFDAAERKAYVSDAVIAEQNTGLLGVNLLPFLLVFGLVAGGATFGLRRLQRGSVQITIRSELDATEELFTVVLSKSPTPPALGNAAEYAARVRGKPPEQKGFVATRAGKYVRFTNVPSGTWFAHLYGTWARGKELRVLGGEALTREVSVSGRNVSYVTFTVDAAQAEFHVVVLENDTPVAGAKVWIDDAAASAVTTRRDGLAVVHATKGLHVIHVEANGLHVERPYEVVKHKIHELPVNLSWERRVDRISRVLETQDISPAEAAAIAPEAVPKVAAGGGAPSLASPAAPRAASLGAATPEARGKGRAPAPAAPGPASVSAFTGLRRYEQTAELGRGAMGIVYRARDLVLERDVALKIMSAEIRDNPELAAKFFHEARALASLNHPNIVTVYDQGEDDGELFLVMELVEGGTVADLLAARGRLPLPDVVDLGAQLCAGMAYAHGRRIIHRDIKPANLFVTTDGVVKIGDFGLARAIASLQISHTRIQGTPLYMPPEQIQGRDIDFRADLYAIGCTLFELVTGQPPFIEGEVLYHHIHTPPPRASELVPGVPAELDELLLATLAKDKTARIASADEIRTRLRGLRLA